MKKGVFIAYIESGLSPYQYRRSCELLTPVDTLVMNIEAIDHTSPHLATVKTLGRANAATLGHFPLGAFDEYAARGCILVAVNGQGSCVGYLLYSIARQRAKIVHLCVDKDWRGRKIPDHLFSALYARTRSLRGIRADCRHDYAAANQMWQRLGFFARGERLGRGLDRKRLTVWWWDHGHPDLFTFADMQHLKTEPKLRVAIDANVFYDLVDSQERDSDESQALLADWLQAELDLCITDELWNEINRSPDEQQRWRAREQADTFTRLRHDYPRFEQVSAALQQFFPSHRRENDASDLRQLARTIAADVSFFVTRDKAQLRRADEIYHAFGLSILSPADLIIHLDELRREVEYRPARLAGTHLVWQRLQQAKQPLLAEHFQRDALGETKSAFQQYLRRLLSTPDSHACYLVLDNDQQPLALVAYGQNQPDTLTVPLFRMCRGSLSTTLVRYFLLHAVQRSASEQRVWTSVTDPYLDEDTIAALQDDGFIQAKSEWVKVSLAVAESTTQLAQRLQGLTVTDTNVNDHIQRMTLLLQKDDVAENTSAMVGLEQMLWPAKITNAAIPTFIVPIQPHWAEELFDKGLAEQTLFGATRLLTLNREGVYYRAYKPSVLSAPGRILWYISGGRSTRVGIKAIRACSRLDEIVIDTPRTLFRRYRRLGIYEWKDVLQVAKEDPARKIMAVRFSHTELFTHPVFLNDIREIYREEAETRFHIQSPARILEEAIFTRIYRSGRQIEV
jgi:ribosomal protein S18 acetylase RimI-like enzyme/predicted nucleic acid-binding protein